MVSLIASLQDLSNNPSLEDSLRVCCKVINTLDTEGRKDLSIPLRKLYARCLEEGSNGIPSPFLLRRLEKDCLEAWCSSHVESRLPDREVKSSWQFSLYTPTEKLLPLQSLTIERLSPLEFEFSLPGSLHRTQRLTVLESILGSAEAFKNEHKDIRPGVVDIYHRDYDLRLEDEQARIQCTYFCHSEVETTQRICCTSEAQADRFIDRLQHLEMANIHSESFRTTLRKGVEAMFNHYRIPSDISHPEAKDLQKLWGIDRSRMIGHYRDFKEHLLRTLIGPPCNESEIQDLAKTFWKQFAHYIEHLYPGYPRSESISLNQHARVS